MRDERGSVRFEARKATLELVLRMALNQGILEEADYSRLLREIGKAKTLRGLEEIQEELKRIVRARERGKDGDRGTDPHH